MLNRLQNRIAKVFYVLSIAWFADRVKVRYFGLVMAIVVGAILCCLWHIFKQRSNRRCVFLPQLEDVPKTAQDGTDDYGNDKAKIPDFNTVSKPSDREYIKDLCDAILEPIEHLMSTNKALWASLTENM